MKKRILMMGLLLTVGAGLCACRSNEPQPQEPTEQISDAEEKNAGEDAQEVSEENTQEPTETEPETEADAQVSDAEAETPQADEYTLVVPDERAPYWTNGSCEIYVDDSGRGLYRKTLADGTEECLQELNPREEGYFEVAYIFDDVVYLNEDYVTMEWNVWSYDMETGDFACAKKGCHIHSGNDRYLICSSYVPSDVSPYPMDLYEITADGMSLFQSLGADISAARFINGKIYYGNYPDMDYDTGYGMNVIQVWSLDVTGGEETMLFEYEAVNPEGMVVLQEITEDKISFVEDTLAESEDHYNYYEYDCHSGEIRVTECPW